MRTGNGVAGAVGAAAIAVSAYAGAITVEQIGSHVAKDGVIHAEFTQTRRLAALKRPIISRGKVVVAAGQGILWEIEHPYRAAYVITKDAIAEVDPEGRRKTGQAEQTQHARQATRLIGSLLTLNEHALTEHFAISVSGELDAWTVDLASRDALARFIAGITMRGGSFVEEVTILEASGDSSRLQFRAASKGEPLSARELKLMQGR